MPDAQENNAESEECYPLLIRIYGVLSIIAGGIQVLSVVLIVLLFVLGHRDLLDNEIIQIERHTMTTLVIGVVETIASVTLAGMFVLLGIRLVRGKRHLAALICVIMIVFEALVLICQFMLTGISIELIPAAVNMIILIALQTYSDPALAQERRLQYELHKMETRTEAEEGTLGLDETGKGYIKLNFFNLFWIFVIACVVGLAVEIVWHMTMVNPGVYQDRAGLLYGPFSPIYGVGAVLITIALNRFYNKSFILIFLVAALIGGTFEFFVSWFMETAFGIIAWDYSGTFLNIQGRTNLMFMCMWGMLGLIWVKFVLPAMLKIVNLIPWNLRYVVTSICAILMIADCLLTLSALDCWYQRKAGSMDYENPSAIVQFCNEHYNDEFMAQRFQSMDMDPNKASRVK